MEQFPGMSDGNININDVIEVIETEMNAGQLLPYVEITEQPASKALRFRYECEGRSAGSIPGVNSTPENKTFPSIRIAGYKGRALVVVSCVTKDPPHRPHPHNLVGKETCKKGVCTVEVSSENMTVMFANLGIQCIKRKDIEEALRIREEIRVDPFKTGFEHKKQPTSIDLNAVRLCFQVFLQGTQKGKFNVALPAVVSDPIFDKKAMSDLVISKLSHCSASVAGGMEMILLCEKVAKEDIKVRFFQEKDGKIVWEGFGDFQPTHVHKQTAIAFRTPTYRIQQVDQPVQVYIQLKRPSDGATSEPLPFQMLPLGADDPDSLRRKRQKINNSQYAVALRQMQAEGEKSEYLSKIVHDSTALPGVGLNGVIGIIEAHFCYIYIQCRTLRVLSFSIPILIFMLTFLLHTSCHSDASNKYSPHCAFQYGHVFSICCNESSKFVGRGSRGIFSNTCTCGECWWYTLL